MPESACITVRPATTDDISRLADLLYQVHALHANGRPDIFIHGKRKYTDDELHGILSDPKGKPIFVAVHEDTVVGYAFCIRQIQTADSMHKLATLYIDDLCVDESSRGQGIGKTLYRHVLDYARSADYYNVTLNVWACNPSAMKFYESCGMQVQKIGMETIL